MLSQICEIKLLSDWRSLIERSTKREKVEKESVTTICWVILESPEEADSEENEV